MNSMAQELADMIHGREIGDEITPILRQWAKDNRLVVVYGASDDLVEFDGAWHDEAGAPGIIHLDLSGPVEYIDCDCKWAREAEKNQKNFPYIEAKWCDNPEGAAWTYETKIPHAKFKILDYEDLYCIGIVFSLDDLERMI